MESTPSETASMLAALFSPVTLGDIEVANRIVMAPMTRTRATANGMPTELMVDYYRQRAGAGLIITEGIFPSEQGKGYCRTPGLADGEQQQAWADVTAAVHEAGGRIVAQLMHCGRIAHPDNKQPGAETVAPSAIAPKASLWTDQAAGLAELGPPRELVADEILGVIDDYAAAAGRAMDAGFDGVQLHGTSGYLPAQFLSTGTNRRTDEWGGDALSRTRFTVAVLDAMIAVAGAGRVALRICPDNPYNDLHDDDPEETFRCLLGQTNELGLSFTEVLRLHPRRGESLRLDNLGLASSMAVEPLVVNDSYDAAEAAESVSTGAAAAVSFARPFINNPDFVERLAAGMPLRPFTTDGLYSTGAAFYTEFPADF